MKKLLILLLLCLHVSAYESSYDKGRNLYFDKACANCHGTEAEGNSYYPKLANKKQSILMKKLKDFQRGKASSQKAEIMFGFARELNEKELQYITKFLSEYKQEKNDKYEVSDDILGSVD